MPYGELLIAEALRIYRRYAVEVVEALGLCPWAEHARKTERIAERVLLSCDVAPILTLISEYANQPEIEIVILILPRVSLARRGFEHFVAEVRQAEEERHDVGKIPFAMAAFHPDAAAELNDAQRLIPFLRRTPDPTIQFVRRSSLERVRDRANEGTEFIDLRFLDPHSLESIDRRSLRQRIAETNQKMVVDFGVTRLDELLTDIRRDRDQSYAKILEREPAVPARAVVR